MIAKPKREPTKLDISRLRQPMLWGVAAVAALSLAILASRGGHGSPRLVAGTDRAGVPAEAQRADRASDAQAQVRQLAQAVHALTAENDQLKSRLAVVEHELDDVTGSVARQIAAVKAKASPWPASAPPIPTPPQVIAALMAPANDSPGEAADLPPVPEPAPKREASQQEEPGAGGKPPAPDDKATQYGADIGGALSIQVLRARWLGIHSAHPQLFAGLTPTAKLRDDPKSKHVDLRLVVGPLASADAAKRLCAALAPYRLFCKPTSFDRHHVALE